LQESKGIFDIPAIVRTQPPVEPGHDLSHNLLSLGFQVVVQPCDGRTVLAAPPAGHETLRFGFHNRFRGCHVFLPFPEPLLLNAIEVVDVEKAGSFSIVDARIKIARYGEVENDEGTRLTPGQNLLITLAVNNGFWRTGRADDDVGRA